jgi:pyridoxamine 5'-phosphate oxidase family protein
MSVFTDAEIAYLNSQMLCRLATVSPSGKPHVVPVGYRYNPELEVIDFGGHDFAKRKKFRDVSNNQRVVALVVDDTRRRSVSGEWGRSALSWARDRLLG